MQIALYRGRGADFVLVHASMRPPRRAEQLHGPLRYLGAIHIDGSVLTGSWGAFADQMEQQAFAVVDEADAFHLLGRANISDSHGA